MTEVIMPKMGDGMEEGTLVEWLKKDGEKVKSGESAAPFKPTRQLFEWSRLVAELSPASC